jgi:phosphoglycolate phosphatase
MRYKLAIFDFDGTLADSFPWFRRVLNDVADKFRFRPVADGETETLRGMSAREILTHLRIPRWKVPMIARHMRALMAQDIHNVHPFPGVDAMFRQLSEQGIALAIASSNTEENVRRVLGSRSASLVSHYACGASIFGKATKLNVIARRSGLLPHDMIYIGDEIRDFEAARRLGMSFGAVAWGYTRPETLAALSPTLMLTRIDEISEKLAARSADVEPMCGFRSA